MLSKTLVPILLLTCLCITQGQVSFVQLQTIPPERNGMGWNDDLKAILPDSRGSAPSLVHTDSGREALQSIISHPAFLRLAGLLFLLSYIPD